MSDQFEQQRTSQILNDGAEARRLAKRTVEAGGLLAFRTDTFYGLGTDPFNRKAVAYINQLKEREGKKPVLVVISDAEDIERFFTQTTELIKRLTEHFWPGPLTIIGRARPRVPEEITAGSGTVGLRLPADEEVRALIKECGGALTATSANLAGQEPARTALEVKNYFPRELDLIIDGGSARTEHPSTVVDTSGGRMRVIREGEVSRESLEQSLKS